MSAVTKTTSPLAALEALGQSVWLDNISRAMLTSGELRRLIEQDGLRGMTSNPTIFDKAIRQSTDYDEQIRELVRDGCDVQQIYDRLTIADIREALDLFRPVYEKTGGRDGFVSLEVSPHLARDPERTFDEARELWRKLDRPNAMIKIPGTPEGLPAIERALAEGININVTLLFSVKAYEAVARTYIKALKARHERGLPVDRVASVASFFVSRIDTEVDKRLDALIKADPSRADELRALKGRAAIANARIAYDRYLSLFSDAEFGALRRAGARPQRLLWASVGTKNPEYSDTLYIDELIGPETVSTMPPATYEAFKDHGTVAETLTRDIPAARRLFEQLAAVGIDLDDVTNKLLVEGIDAFVKSFDDLIAGVASKRAALLARDGS